MANESDAQPPRMTDCEKRLARKWYKEGVERVEIASRLGRQLSGVVKFLKQKVKPQPLGRPKLLSVADVDGLVKTLEKMVDEADATYEVSALMLHKASKLKCSIRTMADAVHERGYYFRDLRHKPILTPEDIKDRKRFAAKYKDKSKEWWRSAVHIHLDNHMFKMATKQSGRKLLAKRRVRGVYRKKGKSLRSGHVKPDPKLKLYTGGKGVLKAGGVGGGKVEWGGRRERLQSCDLPCPVEEVRWQEEVPGARGQRPHWQPVQKGNCCEEGEQDPHLQHPEAVARAQRVGLCDLVSS